MFTSDETIDFLKKELAISAEDAPKPYSDIKSKITQINGLYYVTAQTENEIGSNNRRHYFAFLVSEKAQPILNNIYIELSSIVKDPNKLIQLIQLRPITLRKNGKVIYSQPTNLFFIMQYLSGDELEMVIQANVFACDLRDAIKLVQGELSTFPQLDSVMMKMKGN